MQLAYMVVYDKVKRKVDMFEVPTVVGQLHFFQVSHCKWTLLLVGSWKELILKKKNLPKGPRARDFPSELST